MTTVNGNDEKMQENASGFWAVLENAPTIDCFAAAWLSIQCSMLKDCVRAVLVLGDPNKSDYAPIASWPENGSSYERLTEILERTLADGEGLLVELPSPEGISANTAGSYGLAFPVKVDGLLYGAVAVEVLTVLESDLRPTMEGLQWGAVWLENLYRRKRNERDGKTLDSLKAAVDILAVGLREERFEGAAVAFVTEIATRLRCDRVSLGLVRGNHVQVKALSHSALMDKKMNLVRSIRAIMEEALMQRADIVYPLPRDAGDIVLRDHEAMALRHGTRSMITLPLYGEDAYYAVLVLERQEDRHFTPDELTYVKSIASLSGPALQDKYINDRSLFSHVIESLKCQAGRLIGGGYAGRKVAVFLTLCMIVFFSLAKGDYRIPADTVLEGAVCRSIVAPMDGYIKDAPIRAGDVVNKGSVICTMDDRDLRLERLNWLSKRSQYQRQYQEALAEYDRAGASIISAQLDQVSAQLELAESKLERLIIKAPYEGFVLSGDLSQRLGGSVEHGEELFQVAPLDTYRVILKVNERRIADVAESQEGNLVLSSLPGETYEFSVNKITPIAIAEGGENYFRVEASLKKGSSRLRPGMEGVGKINVDRRHLFSIWTRDLFESVSLWFWSWWP